MQLEPHTWAIATSFIDRWDVARLDAAIAQGVALGLPRPASITNRAERIAWINARRTEIMNGLATGKPLRAFPTKVNGRPCTLTASECNEHLRAMPPVPLFGDET